MATYLEVVEERRLAELKSLREYLMEQYPEIANTPYTEENEQKEREATGLSDFEYIVLKGEDPEDSGYFFLPPNLEEIFEEKSTIPAQEAICLLAEADARDLAIASTPEEVAALVDEDETYMDTVANAFYAPTPQEAAAIRAELAERLLLVADYQGPEAVADLRRSRPDLF